MDHQPSIRSFFQPLSSPTNPPKSQPQSSTTTTPPGPAAPNSKQRPPPPPVKSPSSYALPPSQTKTQFQTQTNPQSPKPTPPGQQPPTSSSSKTKKNLFPPPSAAITPISPDQIPALRRINALLLPISYPDSFYKAIETSQSLFSRVITWDGKVVGGVVCRVDPALNTLDSRGQAIHVAGHGGDSEGAEEKEIYIQSLTLLSPYRNLGLATFALNSIIQTATTTTSFTNPAIKPYASISPIEHIKVKALYAHVWIQNTDALTWYAKNGFAVHGAEIRPYYHRLKPDGAWILRRELKPSDYNLGFGEQIQMQNQTSENNTPPIVQPSPPIPETQGGRGDTARDGRERLPQTRSFQNQGPEREWNDLPTDISDSLLKPGTGTGASSRSSSRSAGGGKKKKERVYPKAAFGS